MNSTLIDGEIDSHLKNLRYECLQNSSLSQCKTEVEKYIVLRAQVILGRHQNAQALIKTDSAFEQSPFGLLIANQMSAMELKNQEKGIEALLSHKDFYSSSPYIEGEFYFTLGLKSFIASLYGQSLPYFQLAAESYKNGGYPGQEAIAYFNAAVSANHINRLQAYLSAASKLEELNKQCRLPAVQIHSLMLQSYIAIDEGNFESAIDRLKESIRVAKSLTRKKNEDSAVSFLAYCYIKTDEIGRFSKLADPYLAVPEVEKSFFIRRLEEFNSIIHTKTMSLAQAKALIKKWEQTIEDKMGVILVADLLIERFMRQHEYEVVRLLSQSLVQLCVRNQHAIRLVDFRFHLLRSFINLGQFKSAKHLLNDLEADLLVYPSKYKTHQLAKLKAMFKSRIEENNADNDDKVIARLDVTRHFLIVNGIEKNLVDVPRIEEALQILFQNRTILVSKFFYKLYGMSFDFFMHESRLNSLLGRVRTFFPLAKALERRDGQIILSPDIDCEVVSSAHSQSVERQALIRKLISKFQNGLGLAELEKHSFIPRRTLQLELAKLVSSGEFIRIGQTRNIKYRSIRL